MGLSESYEHKFVKSLGELVWWEGVVNCNGIRGGSYRALYWMPVNGSEQYFFINCSINCARWLQINRCIKLNKNNNSNKIGEDIYNPAYKYDMIWYVIIHYVNSMPKRCGLEKYRDETSWGHQGWVNANSGLTFNIMSKFGVRKGDHIVLVTNVDHVCLISYVFHNKVHTHPANFKTQVHNKVHTTVENLEDKTVRSPTRVGLKKYMIINHKYLGMINSSTMWCLFM